MYDIVCMRTGQIFYMHKEMSAATFFMKLYITIDYNKKVFISAESEFLSVLHQNKFTKMGIFG